MGNIGDKQAVKVLIAILESGDEFIREQAAEALGKIGDKRAIDPLMEALKDEDGYVRQTAGKVLEEMKSL